MAPKRSSESTGATEAPGERGRERERETSEGFELDNLSREIFISLYLYGNNLYHVGQFELDNLSQDISAMAKLSM